MRLKPIAVDDFCAVRSLANVTFSPAGTSACFTVSRAEKKKNCYESRLYLLKDGAVRALTGGGKESSFCYLDENTVLFAADREGEKEPSLSSRYYKIALDGGEAELAYTFPIPVSQVFPLPGGDLLVTGSTFPGFENLYTGDKKARQGVPCREEGKRRLRGRHAASVVVERRDVHARRVREPFLLRRKKEVPHPPDRGRPFRIRCAAHGGQENRLLQPARCLRPTPGALRRRGSVPHGARLPAGRKPLPKAAPISISLHTLSGDPSCFCLPQTESTA